jgi:hypothetical protein
MPAPPSLGGSYRFLTEDQLLAQCDEDHYRASGPGGQKRNKTSNAVRLRHRPTGFIVTATESRSQKENRLYAIRRMRLKLATDLREPIDPLRFEPPDWFLSFRRQERIEASHRHEYYPAAAGLVLDLMKALGGNPATVAINLGVSTSSVIKLLESDAHFWTAANTIRADLGMTPLTHRR